MFSRRALIGNGFGLLNIDPKLKFNTHTTQTKLYFPKDINHALVHNVNNRGYHLMDFRKYISEDDSYQLYDYVTNAADNRDSVYLGVDYKKVSSSIRTTNLNKSDETLSHILNMQNLPLPVRNILCG